MMNIEELLIVNKKQRKTNIVLTIVFGVLLLTSITLFIVLSNYKIELLMQVVGSIVSSLLMIVLLCEVFGWLIPNISMGRFLKELSDAKECKILGRVDDIHKGLITARKGISFYKIEINSTVYFCHDPEIVSKLEVAGTYVFYVRDCFITGVENEK